jgi:hypothetical protein
VQLTVKLSSKQLTGVSKSKGQRVLLEFITSVFGVHPLLKKEKLKKKKKKKTLNENQI